MEMINRCSYDIIADAVRQYANMQHEKGVCEDYCYIANFKQSYNPVHDFEECTEICYLNPDGTVDFEMDFCEGQKFVIDVSIMALYEVGDIMNKARMLYERLEQNENK